MAIHLHSPNHPTLHKIIAEVAAELPRRNQRRHELRIVTCYVDFGAVRQLIKELSDLIKLQSVFLMFEYMDIFRSDRRPNAAQRELESLEAWCRRRDVNFNGTPVRMGALMHAKAYAITQEDSSRTLVGGLTFVSSGNATHRGLGFGHETPNVELTTSMTTLKGVREFLRIWNTIAKSQKDMSSAAANEDEYALKFALFSTGVFLHKWSIPFGSQTAIRYGLTEAGRNGIIQIEQEFKDQFDDLDRDTVSRQPLSRYGGVDTNVGKPLPPHFTRTYTIDTLLGRWCPSDVWSTIERIVDEDDGFTDFVNKLKSTTTPEKLDYVVRQEANFERALVDRGYIEGDEGRQERWKSKVVDLSNNEEKLRRIFCDMEAFRMPYDYANRSDVEALFDSLTQSIEVRTNGSVAVDKVRSAIEQKSLDCLSLTGEERRKLRQSLMKVKIAGQALAMREPRLHRPAPPDTGSAARCSASVVVHPTSRRPPGPRTRR